MSFYVLSPLTFTNPTRDTAHFTADKTETQRHSFLMTKLGLEPRFPVGWPDLLHSHCFKQECATVLIDGL